MRRLRKTKSLRDWALLAFALASSCLYYSVVTNPPQPLPVELLENKEVLLYGTVGSDPERRFGRLTFHIHADSAQAKDLVYTVRQKVGISMPDSIAVPRIGEEYAFRGGLDVPRPLRNPGGFDSRAHYARLGVHYLLKCSPGASAKLLAGSRPLFSLSRVMSDIRSELDSIFRSNIGGGEAALLSALLLGKRSGIRKDILKNFADAGVIHILAVSGLHVGIIWLVFLVLLRASRVPYRLAALLASLFLIFYCYLTGSRPPVIRATIMLTCFSLALLLEREIDGFNAICVAALAILIHTPSHLFDVGFQLSFACTASIIRVLQFMRQSIPRLYSVKRNPIFRWVVSAVVVSFSAQLGSFPLVMYHFNRLTLTPLIANLVVVPLAGVNICLGLLVSVLGIIKGPFLGPIASANWLSLKLTLASVDFFSSIPFTSFRTVRPAVFLIGVWYVLLLLLPELKSSRRARMAVLVILLVAGSGFVWDGALRKSRSALSVVFLDVGQGDCCFLETGSGKAVLIDAGPSFGEYDCGESVVAPFLWERRIRRIHKVVLSHPQNDHIGGMPYVLDHFEIGEVVDAGTVTASKKHLALLRKVKKKGIEYKVVRRGSRIEFEENRMVVLHPDEEVMRIAALDPNFDVNNCSVVILLVCGELQLLFTGDINDEIDQAFDSVDHVDVFKVPHHGSRTPSEAIFSRGFTTSAAIFSVGLRNRFGHPAKEILDGYLRSGARIYRTDRDGAIFFETDGSTFHITTMRELNNLSPIRRFLRKY